MSIEVGHSAASSISFGFGASNDMVRDISHRLGTDRGNIDGSIANRLGSIISSISSNSSTDIQWIGHSCVHQTLTSEEHSITHQSRTDSEVDVYRSLLVSGSSSIVYRIEIIHRPYGIVSHQLRLVKEGVHVNTDLLGLVGGIGQQSYATMVDDSICSIEQSSLNYQPLYVGIVVNSVWGSRSSYNKDMIADVFRRSLNGKGYGLDLTENSSEEKSSSSFVLVDSNVGVLFESEGVVVVLEVPHSTIQLPSRLILIEVCLSRASTVSRGSTGRHIYIR